MQPERQLAGLVYPTCVVLFAGFVVQLAIRHHFKIANFDDWKMFNLMFTEPFLEWLFMAKNGHIMPATLYLLHLDYVHFGGHANAVIAVSLLCTGLALAGLWLAIRAAAIPFAAVSRTILAFMSFLFLWAASLHSLLWGLGIVNVMTAMWTFFAVASLVTYSARKQAGPDRGSHRLVVLAAVFAFFATFTFGSGMGAWAAILAIAIVARYSPKVILALSLAAAASLGAYVSVISRSSDIAAKVSPDVVLRLPVEILTFAASFLGAAFGRAGVALFGLETSGLHTLSISAGALGVIFFGAYAIWLLARPDRVTPAALLAVGLMTFASFGALVSGIARVEIRPHDGVMVRFVIWSAIFWMGAVAAVPSLPGLGSRPGLIGRALAVALPALSLLMLPALAAELEKHQHRQTVVSLSALSLLVGVENDAAIRNLSPFLHPDLLYAVATRFERDRRGFFADPRVKLLGQPLRAGRELAAEDRCRGRVASLVPLETRGAPAAFVTGRISEVGEVAQVSFIAIVDSAGRVKGLGDAVPQSSTLAITPWRRPLDDALWRGYIASFRGSEEYEAWAVLEDGRICRLAVLPRWRGRLPKKSAVERSSYRRR